MNLQFASNLSHQKETLLHREEQTVQTKFHVHFSCIHNKGLEHYVSETLRSKIKSEVISYFCA